MEEKATKGERQKQKKKEAGRARETVLAENHLALS